jgi:hypothetical protein
MRMSRLDFPVREAGPELVVTGKFPAGGKG